MPPRAVSGHHLRVGGRHVVDAVDGGAAVLAAGDAAGVLHRPGRGVQHAAHPDVRWVAECGGEKVFQVNTHVERVGDGVFEMGAAYQPHASRGKEGPARIGGLLVGRMSSVYRVNLAGDLMGLSIHVEGETLVPFSADIEGEVRGGKLAPVVALHAEGRSRLPLPEVAVPARGASWR